MRRARIADQYLELMAAPAADVLVKRHGGLYLERFFAAPCAACSAPPAPAPVNMWRGRCEGG